MRLLRRWRAKLHRLRTARDSSLATTRSSSRCTTRSIAFDAADAAVRRSAERVRAGRRRRRAMRPGRTCSTTAGDRRTRSAGWCCGSAAIATIGSIAASDAVCTALQLTNFWQDLAIDWSRGRLYVPEEIWRAHGADAATLDARRMTPAVDRRRWRDAARGRARCSTGPAGVRRRLAAGCATSCARPGSAGRAFSIASSARLRRLQPTGQNSEPPTH